MTDTTPSDDLKPGTWGAFVKHALAQGVTVEIMPDMPCPDGQPRDCKHFKRVNGDEVLTYAFPMGHSTERKLGFGRMALICNLLKICEPANWPIAF